MTERWTGIGGRIKALREKRGITRDELAKQINTSRTTLYRLESGDQGMTESWLDKLSKALQTPLTDLIVADVRGRIVVKHEANADEWVSEIELPADRQFSIELPSEKTTPDTFGVNVTGPGQSARLAIGSIAVCRPLADDEHLNSGTLYFVREAKDGKYRFSIKELKHDESGRIWLSPPDPAPQFSAIPLNPNVVAIVGVVTGAFIEFQAPTPPE